MRSLILSAACRSSVLVLAVALSMPLAASAAVLWTGDTTDVNSSANWLDDNDMITHLTPDNKNCSFYTGSPAHLTDIALTNDLRVYSLNMNAAATSPVTVGGSYELILARERESGLTTQTASGPMTLNCNVRMEANQVWSVAGASTLVVNGEITTDSWNQVTKVGSGTLLVNNANNYNISKSPKFQVSQGTFGGTGGVAGWTWLMSGTTLSPGADGVGTMTLHSLDFDSGAKLAFDLAGTNASDKVVLPSSRLTLNGQQFSDFTFTTLPGFGPGTYTLIDADSYAGSLGASVSGIVGGYQGTLSISGSDLMLTILVPEPTTMAMMLVGCFGLLAYAWRRRK